MGHLISYYKKEELKDGTGVSPCIGLVPKRYKVSCMVAPKGQSPTKNKEEKDEGRGLK